MKYEKLLQFLPGTDTCCSRQGQHYISAWPTDQPHFCFVIPLCWLRAITILYLCTRACKPESLCKRTACRPRGDGRQKAAGIVHHTASYAASPSVTPGRPRAATQHGAALHRGFQMLLSEPSSSRYRMPITGADLQFMLCCVPDSYSRGIFIIQKQKYCHKV